MSERKLPQFLAKFILNTDEAWEMRVVDGLSNDIVLSSWMASWVMKSDKEVEQLRKQAEELISRWAKDLPMMANEADNAEKVFGRLVEAYDALPEDVKAGMESMDEE